MHIDYRVFNINTIIDAYPIPCINDILDYLGVSVIFSKIKIAQGYHQVGIAKGHEYRAVFQTHFTLFEYCVLPFGLCNAPTIVQRLMHNILQANLDVFCTMYLDDILILPRSSAAYEQHSAGFCSNYKPLAYMPKKNSVHLAF